MLGRRRQTALQRRCMQGKPLSPEQPSGGFCAVKAASTQGTHHNRLAAAVGAHHTGEGAKGCTHHHSLTIALKTCTGSGGGGDGGGRAPGVAGCCRQAPCSRPVAPFQTPRASRPSQQATQAPPAPSSSIARRARPLLLPLAAAASGAPSAEVAGGWGCSTACIVLAGRSSELPC